MSTARLAAPERMARLLAVIPWVAAQDGAELDVIAERFDYPRKQLLGDLQDVVFFVGVHPFTPDTLIDVDIRGDKVWIRYADWFAKPMRLTADEGARLLTAGQSVLAMGAAASDDSSASALLRALTKLSLALGEGAEAAVDIRLGDAPEASLETIREALSSGRQLEMEYYSYGRDDLTRRVVDPVRQFNDQGNWYLAGWCHNAGADRVFRVDRIRSVSVLDSAVEHQGQAGESSFTPTGDDPRIDLVLAPGARWVAEQYPTESTTEQSNGTLAVRLAVTAQPWIERLLLRLGDEARVSAIDKPLPEDLRSEAATRVLGRYR